MQVPLYGSKYAVNTIRRLFHTFSLLYVTHIVQMVVHVFPLDVHVQLYYRLDWRSLYRRYIFCMAQDCKLLSAYAYSGAQHYCLSLFNTLVFF